ncbi:MAG: hypothetical protein IPM98_20295, partial [Lewinellaceae bacterium]|nr:hypothetical protein [Lewinellaceae bacterium]
LCAGTHGDSRGHLPSARAGRGNTLCGGHLYGYDHRRLLIRNRTAFENARRITAMVFDKTGTLTEGKLGVSRIQPLAAGYDNDRGLLATAAARL